MNPQDGALWSKNFILSCLANFFYFGSFYLLLPILPQYVDTLGGTPGQVGLVTGLYTMAAVLIRPYFGQLADRIGRKKVMMIGAGCFTLLFMLYGLVEAIYPLYVMRVAHGLAHAAFLAASAAYIADLAPPARRGEAMGVYGTSNVIAMALFPAWGTAVITRTGDFNYLFGLSATVAGAAFLCILLVKDLAVTNYGGRPASGFLAVSKRREVLVPALALFGGATTYGVIIAFLPLFAPQRGINDIGIFFTAFAASTIASRILIGKLSDRIGRQRVILPCMALVVVAVFMLAQLNSREMLIVTALLYGFGFGAFMPTLNALVVDYTPPKDRGIALGFFTAFMDLGITAGSVILGFVGEKLGYTAMFNSSAVVALASIAVFIIGIRKVVTHER
ncbi:MFS transporter [Sporomusa sp.]|uniref:MFS transporter n=1 Tax=Sporomusa sp. TaxID=2078658 RepID=UPI002BB8A2ED|nr:MFS transporter [Sporomusa sp.]HWR44923.1 MFS transporter [Sporomusa sp.]